MGAKRRGASYQFIYRRFGRTFAAYHSTPLGRLELRPWNLLSIVGPVVPELQS